MDLVHVDKLAKDINGVKYLLVRQDLFNKTVAAKGMNPKTRTKQSRQFQKLLPKRIDQKNLGRSGDRSCWIFQEILKR